MEHLGEMKLTELRLNLKELLATSRDVAWKLPCWRRDSGVGGQVAADGALKDKLVRYASAWPSIKLRVASSARRTINFHIPFVVVGAPKSWVALVSFFS